jgi:histidinol-phosphate/aromatic aminotransferase/cobyric acid decarboxylase-like protein
LDVDDFIHFVERNAIDTVVLINPNNPNGGYVPTREMRRLLDAFRSLELVVLDESFVDFAYEDEQRTRRSFASEAATMENVMLVKSMSKDFGIAGVRAGYALATPERVEALLRNGYLWNISGLTEFFFGLLSDRAFTEAYASARLRYLDEAGEFFDALCEVDGLRAYTTKANFCLVQVDASVPIELLAPLLLVRYGVYVRDCRDKVGLEGGQYLRIAGRKRFENEVMLAALTDAIPALLAAV